LSSTPHLQRRGRTPSALEEAQVAGLTHEGEGVVHGGKTAFIAGALPGERIRFRRIRRHRRHDEGELLELLEAAPERVAPRCPHFGVCGGCVLQHLAPAAQLAAKEAELRDALTRVAQAAPQRWFEPLAGPHWGYRRRARLGAKFVRRKETVVVGFRERAAPYVAQLRSCEVLEPRAAALITPLAAVLTSLSMRERVPQIEVAVADNATALVLRILSPPTPEDEAQLAAFALAQGVRLYLQPGGLDSVRALGAASEPLYYRLPRFDIELQFEPTDFIQVNGAVNESLVQRAAELLELNSAARLLDLYCGLGNFSLPLARTAAQVTGIEGDSTLVERARSNARLNGLSNAEFHVADLACEPDPALPWMRGDYTHVLLDPPRTGARTVLAALARLAPQRLLYVSCHPGSLARDVGILVHEHGFALAAAGVVDMFPHTAHVESLALLSGPDRADAPGART
jgi:23S rRNA (uracil1939-C5)-methyltransferase